jgi:REP element-mobilizing transposase RayT
MPNDSDFPLAYHITWGTYGTRLHGDERGTVDRSMNKFGEPIIGAEESWQRMETKLLRFPPRELTLDQRQFIEKSIPGICVRGGWEYIATAAARDHVHNILRATVDGKDIRKWPKRWISEAMTKRWPVLPEQVWWAECGSVKWIWTEDYFDRAVAYVRKQRATR